MPHLTIADVGPAKIRSLFDRSDFTAEMRRVNLRRRFMIETEAHSGLLADRIVRVYNSPKAREEIQKYTNKTLNIQRRVTDAVAAPIYRWTPSRYLDLGKSGRRANQAWQAVLDEGGIKTKAKTWGRYAFIGNVLFVFPVVREFGGRRKLCFETVLPQDAALIWTDQSDVDPEQPSILVQRLSEDEGGLPANAPLYRAVDADGWWALNSRGEVIERLAVWNHGVPPFSCFRLAPAPAWDFWDSHRGERLAEVTLDVGRIQASMLWIRKEQQRKLLILAASTPDMIQEGQGATPETAVTLWGDPNDVRVQTVDYETKPDAFITDIRFQTESALEEYGIPPGAVNITSGPGGNSEADVSQLKLSVNHSQISLIRDDQIDLVTACERDLAYKTALQLRAGKHPEASRFDPEKVREKARIEFPPLTFMDTPGQRAEIYKRHIELGLMTHAQALMMEHPGKWASEDDAHAHLMRNVDRRNEVAEALAIHNTPKDPTEDAAKTDQALADLEPGKEFRTKSQALGAMGGREKARRVDARQTEE